MKKHEPQNDYARAYCTALESSGVRPSVIAKNLGMTGQSISNWRIRGVSAKHATSVAKMIGCKPGDISPEFDALGAQGADTSPSAGPYKVTVSGPGLEVSGYLPSAEAISIASKLLTGRA